MDRNIKFPIPVQELTTSIVEDIMMEEIPSDNNSVVDTDYEDVESEPEFSFPGI